MGTQRHYTYHAFSMVDEKTELNTTAQRRLQTAYPIHLAAVTGEPDQRQVVLRPRVRLASLLKLPSRLEVLRPPFEQLNVVALGDGGRNGVIIVIPYPARLDSRSRVALSEAGTRRARKKLRKFRTAQDIPQVW